MDFASLTLRANIDPEKLYYKIGEASKILDVNPSVLRYWEGEFSLRTSKSKSNQRLYERKDLEKLISIKNLLYNKKFTLAGAKTYLKDIRKSTNLSSHESSSEKGIPKEYLTTLKEELVKLLKIIKE